MVRLARIEHNHQHKLVAELPHGNGYCDLSSLARDAQSFFQAGPEALARAKELVELATPNNISVEECRLLAPLSQVDKFLCIGMNYVDHCTEQNVPIPKEPVVFSKFASSMIGSGEPVSVDSNLTSKLDYEVELGVVIGTTVPRNTPPDKAMEHVGGYTVVHDVSARDWQLEKNGGQWLLGKAMDGFAPIGPVIVTPDEIQDVHNLNLQCHVNGEILQDSNTKNLVFSIQELLGFLSKFMTLFPGDVIATGTPPGVGCFRQPPRWLVPGDVVECQVEGIGTLVSPIVEAATTIPKPPQLHGCLDGMVCIVTGAAQGIGYGIAARLGLEGASSVAIVDLNKAAIQVACDKLEKVAPWCAYHGIECDVTSYKAVNEAWNAFSKQQDRLDVLVQAAGIVGETNVLTQDVNPDNFDLVYQTNVKGIFNGCKAALPLMKKNGYGRIINIASIAGKEGNAGMLAYSTSKAAVIGLTKTVGKEYACHGITCNALAPAVVRTQMVANMPPDQVKYMTDKIPMKRCGTIQEMASIVAFIASPESAFTTGFCFDATGGRAVY